MKNYNDVKRAASAALRDLTRTIYQNLDNKEADNLCIELSMSLVTATLDFDEELDTFTDHLANLMNSYVLCLGDTVINYKAKVDKGEANEADTI